MYQNLRGVVLNVLKYSDKNSIAHVYTDTRGRMAFLVPQGSTKQARMRNAAFMPLSIIEFEANIMPGKDIHTFQEVRRLYPLASIYGDPVKSAVAMFVSELLAHAIQEREENNALYRYLESTIRFLDGMEQGAANFHICFLYNLGAFLGIQPDADSYTEGAWFDMANGQFTQSRPMQHYLVPEEARVLHLVGRMTFANLHRFRFNREQRGRILDLMLSYYRLHQSTLGSLRSPEVLKMLF